jgi:putative endonuclease
LYIGVTNSIERRTLEHKSGHGSGFTSRYNLTDLLYYERIIGMQNAINREKQLKNWHKEWKWNLIKEENPKLDDLAADWFTDEEIKEHKMLKDSETSSE